MSNTKKKRLKVDSEKGQFKAVPIVYSSKRLKKFFKETGFDALYETIKKAQNYKENFL